MPARRKVKATKNAHPRAARKKMNGPASGGDISLGFIFDEVYRTVAEAGAKKVAPQELEQLKAHLDGATNQLKTIGRKLGK